MRARAVALATVCWAATLGSAFAAEWYDDYWGGVKLVRAQRYAEAVDFLVSAIRSGPPPGPERRTFGVHTTEFYPYYWLGKAYRGSGNAQLARQWLEESVRQNEGDAALVSDRDALLRDLGRVRRPEAPGDHSAPVLEHDVRGVRRLADGSLTGSVGGDTINLGTYHALLIGVAEYASEAFDDLKTPIRDISRLGELLTRHYGFARRNVTYLIDEQATRHGILDAITAYRDSLGPTDNLLVYYAGHGRQEPDTEDGFWLPHAATGRESSWISNQELKRIVRNITAKHTLLISDSCFAGTLHRGGEDVEVALVDRYLSQVHRKDSYQVITSGGLEPVADGGRDGMSVFAYLLNEFLEDQETYFTADELGVHLEKSVSNALDSRQTPEHGPIRETFHAGGQFIFFRVN